MIHPLRGTCVSIRLRIAAPFLRFRREEGRRRVLRSRLTALHWIIALLVVWGMVSVGRFSAGAQASPNALLAKAVEVNNLTDVKEALARGAAPDAPLEGEPVSCTAAFHGQAGILKTLLDRGARLDTRTSIDHRTLLMFAALSANTDTVRLLLERKVKVNLQDVYGATALMTVRDTEAPEAPSRATILRMLLNAGADKELRDRDGRTALMRYANFGVLTGVEILAEAGAKLNLRDREGNTALILAAGWEMGDTGNDPEGYLAIVRYLLQQRVNIRMKNRAGITALEAAAKHGHNDIVALLRAHGAVEKAGRRGK